MRLLKLEMGPDPTRAYFWPAVNKRPTRLWPRYFSTRPKEIFFDPKGKKLKNLTFLGEIFQIQTQTINGWPKLTKVKKFWPGPITIFDTFWKLRIGLLNKSFLVTNLKCQNIIYFSRAHLANHDELISKSFQGSHGKAYLFNSVVNVSCGHVSFNNHQS